MKMRGDTRTADLLAWEPPEVVRTFPADHVRAASLRAQISKAVGAALKDSDVPRDDMAQAMSDYLGEVVPKTALDGYASEAREDHTISVVRLMALVHATGDIRLLQMLAEPFGCIVVERRYQHAVNAAMKAEMAKELRRRAEELDHEQQLDIRAWKGA